MVVDLGDQSTPMIMEQMNLSAKEADTLRKFMAHSFQTWESSTNSVSDRILCSGSSPDRHQLVSMQEIISDIRETFIYKQYSTIYVHFGKPVFNNLNEWLSHLPGSSVSVSISDIENACQGYAMH